MVTPASYATWVVRDLYTPSSSGQVNSGSPGPLYIFTTQSNLLGAGVSVQVVATEEVMAVRVASMLDTSCAENAMVSIWVQLVPGGST